VVSRMRSEQSACRDNSRAHQRFDSSLRCVAEHKLNELDILLRW
jgi:hypothetical protein